MLRIFTVTNDTNLQSLGTTLLDARVSGAQAAAALEQLRALNPQADLQTIPAGTVLFVPDSPAFKTSVGTSPRTAPIDDFRALLSRALSGAVSRMKASTDARAQERNEAAAAFADAAFTRIAGSDRGLAQQVSDAQKAMATEESNDKRALENLGVTSQSALEALSEINKVAS
jgi:hypothetical protein